MWWWAWLGTSRRGKGKTSQARDRPVLGVIGDGSTLYANQALWTAAHYRIPVVWLICNNAQYMILKRRLHAYGGAAAKAETYIGLDMRDPEVDFLSLARVMGRP